MKAKDLRIGNYAQDQNRNILIVYALTTRDMNFKVVDRSKFPLPKGWKAEPIPLTEEWLLKFGFEKALNGWWDESENWCCNNNDFYLGAKMFLAKVDYVHQLQNLYFVLTGKELTI